MAKRSSLRASDADRESVAERLREAAGEGRLLAHELEERLATALRARTYGDLDSVVADLPVKQSPRPRRSRLLGQPAAFAALLIAVTLVAAAVAAVAMIASGAWIVVAILFVAVRGRRLGRGGYRGRRVRGGPMHAHHHARW